MANEVKYSGWGYHVEAGAPYTIEFGGIIAYGVTYPANITWVTNNGLRPGAREQVVNFVGDTLAKLGNTNYSVVCTSDTFTNTWKSNSVITVIMCEGTAPSLQGGDAQSPGKIKNRSGSDFKTIHRLYSPPGKLVSSDIIDFISYPSLSCPIGCSKLDRRYYGICAEYTPKIQAPTK